MIAWRLQGVVILHSVKFMLLHGLRDCIEHVSNVPASIKPADCMSSSGAYIICTVIIEPFTHAEAATLV